MFSLIGECLNKEGSFMKVVILCGGKGTRMGPISKVVPKPMIRIGPRPILHHIMQLYSHYGFRDFILCLGHEQDKIRGYFKNFKKWNIKFTFTGLDTGTGGRIKMIEKYITEDNFFATYGDGLSNINLERLLKYHRKSNKIATITAIQPKLQFGVIKLGSGNSVLGFKEKPTSDSWINGGFFVFKKDIFKYMKKTDVLEKQTFSRLIPGRNLVVYQHKGFWRCMDTYKDTLELNNLWRSGKKPWVMKGK